MKQIVVAALAAVLGLTLVGCGDDAGEGAEPGAPVTVTETVTPTPEPTPVESATPTDAATTEATETTAPPADGLPATYADALALFDEYGQEGAPLRRFATPDLDIYCVLSDKVIPPSCEIGEGAIEDLEVCGDAPSQLVGRIEIRRGRAEPVCNLDSIRADMPEVLEPGQVAAVDGMQCLNAGERGVVCLQTFTGAGFALRAGEYTTFEGLEG